METTIFDTALGAFGIGWTDAGLARVQLPGLDHEDLLARLNRGDARTGSPTRMIDALINRIDDYASGVATDFSDVPLDLTGVPPFHRKAYAALMSCGWGCTTSYGALAATLGDVTLSRAVGQAMGANPIPLVIPCHRVLTSAGKSGGFSAPGGALSKLRMLALEGVSVGAPTGRWRLDFSYGY